MYEEDDEIVTIIEIAENNHRGSYSIFKNVNGIQENKLDNLDIVTSRVSIPSVRYVHTSGNREKTTEKDNNIIFSLSECSKKLKWNNPDEHSKKYFYASVENQVKRQ